MPHVHSAQCTTSAHPTSGRARPGSAYGRSGDHQDADRQTFRSGSLSGERLEQGTDSMAGSTSVWQDSVWRWCQRNPTLHRRTAIARTPCRGFTMPAWRLFAGRAVCPLGCLSDRQVRGDCGRIAVRLVSLVDGLRCSQKAIGTRSLSQPWR